MQAEDSELSHGNKIDGFVVNENYSIEFGSVAVVDHRIVACFMGKVLDPNKIKVNSEKFVRKGGAPCQLEIFTFLDCIKKKDFKESEDCEAARLAMINCWEKTLESKIGKKHKPTINYHLQVAMDLSLKID